MGMPSASTGIRGRAVAQVRVKVPTELSREAREALEHLADVLGESYTSQRKSVGERIRDAIDDMLD